MYEVAVKSLYSLEIPEITRNTESKAAVASWHGGTNGTEIGEMARIAQHERMSERGRREIQSYFSNPLLAK